MLLLSLLPAEAVVISLGVELGLLKDTPTGLRFDGA